MIQWTPFIPSKTLAKAAWVWQVIHERKHCYLVVVSPPVQGMGRAWFRSQPESHGSPYGVLFEPAAPPAGEGG